MVSFFWPSRLKAQAQFLLFSFLRFIQRRCLLLRLQKPITGEWLVHNQMIGCSSDWSWANLSYNLGSSLEGERKSKISQQDSRYLCAVLGPRSSEYASGIPTTWSGCQRDRERESEWSEHKKGTFRSVNQVCITCVPECSSVVPRQIKKKHIVKACGIICNL